MRRPHAISPGFYGHYQDLGMSSLTSRVSVCNLILSVDICIRSTVRMRMVGAPSALLDRVEVQGRLVLLLLAQALILPFRP